MAGKSNFSGIGKQPSFGTLGRGNGPQPHPNSHFAAPRPRRKTMVKRGLPKMSMKASF